MTRGVEGCSIMGVIPDACHSISMGVLSRFLPGSLTTETSICKRSSCRGHKTPGAFSVQVQYRSFTAWAFYAIRQINNKKRCFTPHQRSKDSSCRDVAILPFSAFQAGYMDVTALDFQNMNKFATADIDSDMFDRLAIAAVAEENEIAFFQIGLADEFSSIFLKACSPFQLDSVLLEYILRKRRTIEDESAWVTRPVIVCGSSDQRFCCAYNRISFFAA